MTTGLKRFILRFIVGLLTFLIGVATAMAFAGFWPFESSQSGQQQQNYRHYRYKKSCNFKFRSWNAPPPPLMPAPPVGSHAGTVHLKETTVILEN